MTADQRIHERAKLYIGTKETPGPKSTALIAQWIKQAAEWLDRDDSKTAWCGCFRGAIGYETGTGVPPAHYRAANWAKWGKPVPLDRRDLWRPGMTVVLPRSGGNHVAIYHAPKDLDRVILLGGNQADAVSLQTYSINRITAVRTAG